MRIRQKYVFYDDYSAQYGVDNRVGACCQVETDMERRRWLRGLWLATCLTVGAIGATLRRRFLSYKDLCG